MDQINQRIAERVQLQERKNKSPTTANLIMGCLKNTFMLYNLTEAELEAIRDNMFYCHVEEGRVVFDESMDSTCFFVVERGSLELLVDGVVKKEIKPGEGKD